MDRRTVHPLSRAPVVLVALLGLATGCTGSPASTSAWQGTSDRTIGTLIAALGTARIVVREVAQDDVQHSYAVVTVTDVIETSSKELSGYQVGQPPDRLHRAHDEVVRTLQGALALLVEVRVELGSPGLTRDAARRLLDEIDVARDQLDELDSAVMSSPASVGAG
jgi:hypothetical protein